MALVMYRCYPHFGFKLVVASILCRVAITPLPYDARNRSLSVHDMTFSNRCHSTGMDPVRATFATCYHHVFGECTQIISIPRSYIDFDATEYRLLAAQPVPM